MHHIHMGKISYLWFSLCVLKLCVAISSDNTSKTSNIFTVTLDSETSSDIQEATGFLKKLQSSPDIVVYKWYKDDVGRWIFIVEASSPGTVSTLSDTPQVAVMTLYTGKPLHLPQNVKDEYIIVLRKVADAQPDDVMERVSTALTGNNVVIMNTFKIGTYRAIVIQATDLEAMNLTNQLPHLTISNHAGGVLVLDDYVHKINPNVLMWSNMPSGSESEVVDNAGPSKCSGEHTGQELWGLSRLNMNRLQDYGSREYTTGNYGAGQNVSVYVFDTGIYTEHEDFQGRAVWGHSAPNMSHTDGQGHGTHVAGTVGSYTYGVAKNVQLIAVKVLDDSGVGSMADLHSGLQWAYNDYMLRGQPRTVWSLSMGTLDTWFCTHQDSPLNVFTDAYKAGITVVAAAGNQAQDACNFSPACFTETIAVAASSSVDRFLSSSNYGSCVSIVAPGSDILSTYIGSPTATARMSGTSMATPHVAGVVARYISAQSDRPSPDEVKQWLKEHSLRDELNHVPLDTNNALLHIPCGAQSLMVVTSLTSHIRVLLVVMTSSLLCAVLAGSSITI